MTARFGDYELVTALRDFDDAVLWLARDVDGDACELVVYAEMRDDVDEAFFRGEDVPRLRAVSALANARFPRMTGAPLRFDNRNAVAFAHAPLVTTDELQRRARADEGLAVPLVRALVRDVADALAVAHAAGISGFDCIGAGVDGRVRLIDDRVRDEPASDVGALGALSASLAFGGSIPRVDFPVRVTSAIAWMLDRTNRPSAAAIVEWLDDDELAWARWTPEQVSAELRALFPDLEARR